MLLFVRSVYVPELLKAPVHRPEDKLQPGIQIFSQRGNTALGMEYGWNLATTLSKILRKSIHDQNRKKKVFRFFQFFFSEKSENFTVEIIKETWNSKIEEKIALKISDSKKNEKSKLHIIPERWLKSEGNSLRNKKVTADLPRGDERYLSSPR